MREITQKRMVKLRKKLARSKLDAFLVLIEENRRYLSGFTGEDTQFDESAGALLITGSKQVLLTDSRFELQAKREAPLYQVVCYREGLVKELPGRLKRLKVKSLGFESIRISYAQHKKLMHEIENSGVGVELVETEDMVETQRIQKNRTELATIQKALAIAESVFEKTITHIKPGMSEKEIAWAMEKEMREEGADGLSFETIVAAGPNSALPHAVPGDRKIKAGEPVLFDWGVRLNGYCSDISRTLLIGKPDARFNKVYRTVRDAQMKAIDAIRPGISTREVDAVARSYIEKKGFKGRFGHGLGHGVGLAIHEQPRLSPLSNATLKTGMVVTVEPGIYIPGWGGVRIENMVAVKRNGVHVLNRLGTDTSRVEI